MVNVLFHQTNDVLNCGRFTLPSFPFSRLEPLFPVRLGHIVGECVPLIDCLEVAVMVEGIDDLANSVCEGCGTKLKRVNRILRKIDNSAVSGQNVVSIFSGIIDDHDWNLLQIVATRQESLDECRLSSST